MVVIIDFQTYVLLESRLSTVAPVSCSIHQWIGNLILPQFNPQLTLKTPCGFFTLPLPIFFKQTRAKPRAGLQTHLSVITSVCHPFPPTALQGRHGQTL